MPASPTGGSVRPLRLTPADPARRRRRPVHEPGRRLVPDPHPRARRRRRRAGSPAPTAPTPRWSPTRPAPPTASATPGRSATTAAYTVGVWVGRPDGSFSPGRMGREAAAPILFDVFDQLPMPPDRACAAARGRAGGDQCRAARHAALLRCPADARRGCAPPARARAGRRSPFPSTARPSRWFARARR